MSTLLESMAHAEPVDDEGERLARFFARSEHEGHEAVRPRLPRLPRLPAEETLQEYAVLRYGDLRIGTHVTIYTPGLLTRCEPYKSYDVMVAVREHGLSAVCVCVAPSSISLATSWASHGTIRSVIAAARRDLSVHTIGPDDMPWVNEIVQAGTRHQCERSTWRIQPLAVLDLLEANIPRFEDDQATLRAIAKQGRAF